MENILKNKKQNVIISVEKDSIAEELGIQPGHVLISINNKEVLDVFDYRYLINDEYLEMRLETDSGEEYIAEIEKDYYEDIGIVFESGLMDEAKNCSNKCIFCFIDQLPPGMRETLYFKDDDSRLSFLQGNYVTLTNMKDKDIDRIVFYHLSPINISVHTTDPELRKKMLCNKNAGKVLEIMKRFAGAGIEMNLQVVLCKGINDGAFLDKTIEDVSKFYPHAQSVSIVPIGLTKYRDNLYPQKPFTKSDAEDILEQIEIWQNRLLGSLGTRFVFPADEFYLKAQRELPRSEVYEDFSQFENGVGMLSLFYDEFQEIFSGLSEKHNKERIVSTATGSAAISMIQKLSVQLMEKFPKLKIYNYEIKNNFFGEMITVSGLLTGADIIAQLTGKPLGEYLVLPDSLLRNGETVLLDDVYIGDIEKSLCVDVKIAFNSAESFIKRVLDVEEI